jgi:hypothetical protein
MTDLQAAKKLQKMYPDNKVSVERKTYGDGEKVFSLWVYPNEGQGDCCIASSLDSRGFSFCFDKLEES